jgi:hypothetical protein
MDGESFPDQGMRVEALRNHVASLHSGRFPARAERAANFVEDFAGEKGDLSLVVVSVTEEAVAANTVARCALVLPHFKQWIFAGRVAVMAKARCKKQLLRIPLYPARQFLQAT